jgi:hypothetical protein
VCGRPECQRRRRSDYHRKKLATDPEYFQVVRDSQKQWWDEHPGYQKQHRQQNPKLIESNRQRQRLRDWKRRVELLVRNVSFGPKAFSIRGLAVRPQGAQS